MAPVMLMQEIWDRLWTLKNSASKRTGETGSREGDPTLGGAILQDGALHEGVWGEMIHQRDEITVYDASRGRSTSPTPDVELPACIELHTEACFVRPEVTGDPAQRPHRSPLLLEAAQVGQPSCGLLPGIDIVAPGPSLVLAPMDGTLLRYADQNGHLTVQIENEAWTLWLTGLRSYTAPEGPIRAGDPVGAIGGIHSRTPSVHYAVYDRLAPGFVDARAFLPSSSICP
jgi:hypothetical protein